MNENSSNKKINKDIIKLTITKVLTSIISVVISMLLARYRTLNEYGTYSQMLIVINLFTSIFMLGLPNSLNYFVSRAETEDEKKSFVSVYYTLSTILSFILGLSLILSINLIVNYFDNEYIKTFIYFLAIFPWTKIITSSIDNLLVVYEKTKLLFIIKLLHNSILLLLVIFFQITKISFEIYMIAFTVFEGLVTIIDYFVIRKVTGAIKPKLAWKMIKRIFVFSVPIGLSSIVGMINIELDKIVIDRFFTTEELGIYTACSTELPLTMFSSSITAVALPAMVVLIKNGDVFEAIEKWKKTIIVSLFIIAIFSLGLTFFAEDAVALLYGNKYLSGANVFRIYSVILIFKCTYWGIMLNSMGKTKFILFSSIISLILNIGLNYLLCYFFGFIGPAIATLISTFIMNLCQLIATKLITKIKFANILPWKEILMILGANIILGVLFYYLKIIIPLDNYINSIGETLLLACLWGLIYISIFGKKILKIFKEI